MNILDGLVVLNEKRNKPAFFPTQALFLLIFAVTLARPGSARADCPGCGLAVLALPVELLIVDGVSTLAVFAGGRMLGHEGRMGPAFVAGLWGGAAGFVLGSIASSIYFRDPWTAMGIGGAVVGLPVGTFIGVLYGFAKDAGTAPGGDDARLGSPDPFHIGVFPVEKGVAARIAVQF